MSPASKTAEQEGHLEDRVQFAPHPSWLVGPADLEHLPPVQTRQGSPSPRRIADYHIDFANLEMARPASYYRTRLEAIGFTGFDRVLDAGCGVGQWSLALAAWNQEVHGIDLSEERLALAHLLARRNGVPSIHLTHGTVEDLPFPDSYFDAVFCYGVFMFPHPRLVLREFARVLRPGGRLYICANGLGWSLYLIFGRRLRRIGLRTITRTILGKPRDNFLTRGRMRRLCAGAGFRIDAWGGEGKLRVAGSSGLVFEPVYRSRYLGVTCVWELLATRSAAAAPGQARRIRAATTDPLGLAEAAALTARAQDFESPRYRLPAIVTVATPTAYAPEKIQEVRQRFRDVDRNRYLDVLVDSLVRPPTGPQDAVERIIRFVQAAFFHNPLEQPPVELDVFTLLQLGEGRCGHVARVVADLLRRAGFPARLRHLRAHIVAETFLDGAWRLVDADAYKNGVILTNREGRLLSMDDLEENPYQIDRFPPSGLWVRQGSRYARNAAGLEVTGYVDAIDLEDRGFMSGKYASWIEPEYPPSVPRVDPQADHVGCPVTVRLSWSPSTDRDGDLRGYSVRVGTTSKGYSSDRMRYERILCETGSEIGEYFTSQPHLDVVIARPGRYFWSVKAMDDHMLREPETFYWSSDEDEFVVT